MRFVGAINAKMQEIVQVAHKMADTESKCGYSRCVLSEGGPSNDQKKAVNPVMRSIKMASPLIAKPSCSKTHE